MPVSPSHGPSTSWAAWSPLLGSPSPGATWDFSPKYHTMAQPQARRCPQCSGHGRTGSGKKEQAAPEAAVSASRAPVAPTPALAGLSCPRRTVRGAVFTWGLPLKSTSSTRVLRDGSARARGCAHRQSVPAAGLPRGHQPQHRPAAMDVARVWDTPGRGKAPQGRRWQSQTSRVGHGKGFPAPELWHGSATAIPCWSCAPGRGHSRE